MEIRKKRFITADQVFDSLKNSFKLLDPRVQFRNPVMFVTYLGAILTTIYAIVEGVNGPWVFFHVQIALWLWFTVLFANFAEAIAESRGKAQALSLKKSQVDAFARRIKNDIEENVSSQLLKKGDIVVCEVGDIIPADGEVVEGIATVDESAITGESAPVIRESGGDRSAVTAGTKVVSDRLLILVTSETGKSFLDHMIRMIEGAKRQKSPNEIALHILLCGLTIVFIITVFSLKLFAEYTTAPSMQATSKIIDIPVLVALLVCLIPTTISALLSAVGIAGMDRLICSNVIAKSGRSVEAAGDIDLLILDKTGTITMGSRMATALFAAPGVSERDLAEIAQLASLSDETPEGRSIVVLAKNLHGLRAESLNIANSVIVPFSANTRMSGIDFLDADGNVIRKIRKGAADAIKKNIENLGGVSSEMADVWVMQISNEGGTPLLVSDDQKIVGVIQLKDIVKGGIRERFDEMRQMGIRTLMITGDNPFTAAAIAAEAGVDDFVAEATPEMKLQIIKREQSKGSMVAMAGDGTNDAPALAQADVAVAMNTGTQASREAGNMVDLDSNPTKLIDIVEIGKQLLITRGALTTFSITNDIAKYFAIIPAIFGMFYAANSGQEGPLGIFNIMMLNSHKSAILSAVIFNALIIIALIPLALKGVNCRAQSAQQLLQRNVLIYGIGGIVVPFIGIKLIDMFISYFNWV
ncbi:MAG TPA: potassium-transporting ATPase subunit KdpB [Parachlamydiaceae bacterium]|nr:potassium-transporting ATPase subunit KdpB [Parachlamydiaceae bacterium]